MADGRLVEGGPAAERESHRVQLDRIVWSGLSYVFCQSFAVGWQVLSWVEKHQTTSLEAKK